MSICNQHGPFSLTHNKCQAVPSTKQNTNTQLKELKSRLADMEGQSRSSAGVSQLELQVQELEERLRSEDRWAALHIPHYKIK